MCCRAWSGQRLKVAGHNLVFVAKLGDLVSEKLLPRGFVPLLHTAVEWRFADDWRMLLDVDVAWAPQGRATDATLHLRRTLGEHLDLGFGYRTIEGGADNDEVFTFSWLHQAVVSIGVRF
ncbi:MAG: hypothetical protein ACI8UD_003602 [Planctomycetota bacterium]|jgi:hypothetical protein